MRYRWIVLLCAAALLAPIVLQGCGGHSGSCPAAFGPCYKPANPEAPVIAHDNSRHYQPYRRTCYHRSYNCCPYYYW